MAAVVTGLATRRRAALVLLIAGSVCVVNFIVLRNDPGGGGMRPAHMARCSPADHPLSLVPLADGRGLPARLTPDAALACLQRRRVRRVLFIGHSRIRQVFERMTLHLALPPVTRFSASRVALSPAEFRDFPQLREAWHHFAAANSTCLEVWPKAHPDGSGAVGAWCSLASAGPGLTLEFRWRFQLKWFLSTLHQLSAACQAGDCVDVLVLVQGLHFLALDAESFSRASSIYTDTLRRAATMLRAMVARGTRVVWMLEQAANIRNRRGAEGMNDDMALLAAFAREGMLEPPESRAGGVWMWSSHLRIVNDFLFRSCAAKQYESPSDANVCDDEIFHVNAASLDRMSDQVLDFMCTC